MMTEMKISDFAVNSKLSLYADPDQKLRRTLETTDGRIALPSQHGLRRLSENNCFSTVQNRSPS